VVDDTRPFGRAAWHEAVRIARVRRVRERNVHVGMVVRVAVLGLLLAGGPLSGGSAERYGVPTGAGAADRTATVPGDPTATRPAEATPTLRLVAQQGAQRKPELHRWKGHPGRLILRYRVRAGDTATGLAVRYHAWTDELLALNHLKARSVLYVGQRVRVPIVVAAARAHGHAPGAKRHGKAAGKPHKAKPHKAKPHHKAPKKSSKKAHAKWRGADASRAHVRKVIVRAATRHGVDPYLALAVAWQESGWQQHRVSSAGALGVMQVMPGTGEWMEMYLGRPLHLRHLHDNIAAGVVLLDVLDRYTGRRKAVGAYYQGLGSVQRDGLSKITKHYVANVLALRKRLKSGWDPA
jgi:LysM repeat protein